MRRMTAIVAVCVSALTGCQGGGSQGPAAVPAPQASEVEPIASEVRVPWAIALVSDARTPAPKKPGKVIVVDVERDAPEAVVQTVDLHVAVDPRPAAEKPATPKTCSGVVKTRS
jgi:hypothetical protein